MSPWKDGIWKGLPASGGSGTPAGSNMQVQYNDGGVFGGASNVYYDDINSRLGIGTSSPAYILDVAGQMAVTGASNGIRILNRTTGASHSLFYQDSNILYLYDLSADANRFFWAVNTTRFGIGVTPSVNFHVVSVSEQMRIGYSTGVYYSTTVSSGGVTTFNAVGGSAKFVFSDYVGIKVTPSYPFHVRGDQNANFEYNTVNYQTCAWIEDDAPFEQRTRLTLYNSNDGSSDPGSGSSVFWVRNSHDGYDIKTPTWEMGTDFAIDATNNFFLARFPGGSTFLYCHATLERIGMFNSNPDASLHVTGTGHFTSNIELDGALNHDGTTVGFYGVTPVARSTGWSVTNVTTDKVYDANSTTLNELADVLGTLINALKTIGILGT